MRQKQSRRQFLQIASAGTAACLTGVNSCASQQSTCAGQDPCKSKQTCKAKFRLGMASYSLRRFKLEQALEMTKRVGLKHICLKSYHLEMDSTPEQIAEAATKVKEAGLELYGGGVIYMRSEEEVNQAFEYAKVAGMKIIVGVAEPELLEMVDKKVRQYDIKVAIHNHGPEDKVFPTPASAYEKIKNLDKRIGLCIDIAHTQRCGVDPAESAEMFADRLYELHLNDVSTATKDAKYLELGRGIIDVPKLFRTLIKVKFAGIASFEYVKDGKDPLPGVAESVGYAKGVLAAI